MTRMAKHRANPGKKRGAKRGRPRQGAVSPYYVQPGKRGAMVVLRKPCGNRASPKICGVMPSKAHAKALVDQLSRAESAANDLFYEATDDGIEALEAVLAACRAAVLDRMPVSAERAAEMTAADAADGPEPAGPPPANSVG
jgi:hypothetical protein